MTDSDLARFKDFWQMMPGRVSITFRNQITPGTYETAMLANCWFRDKGLMEADTSLGVYVKDLIDWHIPMTVMADRPTPGDVITYGGNDFVVMPEGVEDVGAMGSWKVSTGRFFLQNGLSDTIAVYRPQPAQDETGRLIAGTEQVIGSNIPAKVQIVDSFAVVPVGPGDFFGKSQIPGPARVYIASVIRVQPGDWMVDQNGRRYGIRNEVNINRLGELMALDVEQLR